MFLVDVPLCVSCVPSVRSGLCSPAVALSFDSVNKEPNLTAESSVSHLGQVQRAHLCSLYPVSGNEIHRRTTYLLFMSQLLTHMVASRGDV